MANLRIGSFALPLLGAVILAAGCGSSAPSKQLVDARAAYDRATASKAESLTPDRLLEAKQALDDAERAHRSEARSAREIHLAYIAERKSLAAIAYGEIAYWKRKKASADEEYTRLLEKRRSATESALAANRRRLAETRAELARKGDTLDNQSKALKEREAELARKQKELEAAEQARLAAEKKAADALKSLEEVAKIKEEQRGMVITLSGAVLFKSDTHELLPIAENKLEQVAAALVDTPDERQIVVEGHTDSRGSNSYNENLSRKRAEAVRTFLISKGISANRIVAVGKGESQPIANNRTADGRANNRRVEIIVAPPR